MAFRTFCDADGNEWQAFDVVPRSNERRRYDRRSGPRKAVSESDRRDGDRRITVGGRSPLASGVHEGWLCFERGDDRRRLSPIPPNWRRATDDELDAYRRAASPVRVAHQSTPAPEPKP